MKLILIKTTTLQAPEPFNFKLTVRKPAGWDWATPYETFDEESNTLRSAIRLSTDRPVGLRLHADGEHVEVSFYATALSDAEQAEAVERVKLGLGFDDKLMEFYALGKTDPLIEQLSHDLYGMRIGHPQTVFETALLTITLQMAPMKRSEQMLSCLIDSYGEEIEFDGKRMLVWPTPVRIAALEPDMLGKKCVLGYRAKFVVQLAHVIASGFPDILAIARMPEAEAHKLLQTLPGIGEYSASIISPHYGVALDVWTTRVLHEILFGTTPEAPRMMIREVQAAAEARWGRFKGYVLYYTLHDLPNLQERYGITRLA